MPGDVPVTIPAPSTVALASTLQVPPVVASLRDIVNVLHTALAPEIAAGIAYTLITEVAAQPDDMTYPIVDVPVAIPVTRPVEPIVAAVGLLLLHVPPLIISLNVNEDPIQAVAGPEIVGVWFTVIITPAAQPVGNV